MSRIDSISRALETEYGINMSNGKIVSVEEHDTEKAIALIKPHEALARINNTVSYIDDSHQVPVISKENVNQAELDYELDEELAKNNIRELIGKGMDLADDMFDIVRVSESPKGFEPAAQYLKALVEMNESLLAIHDRKFKRKSMTQQPNKEQQVNNTQNNTILCADPSDILKRLLGKDKS